jgi:hypothetical protein
MFFERTSVMPSMIHTGVYGSVLHYRKAIKAAETLAAFAVRPSTLVCARGRGLHRILIRADIEVIAEPS